MRCRPRVRDGLADGFRQAIADSGVKAIVLVCDGKTFIAGADISEFGKAPKGASLFDVQNAIENSPKPVVAAIHGTALGGGLEVALCCHYRVAVPSARCGLPEVNIGLLPGAGGTQRLPRIVGVEKALEMVTSGQHVPAKACLEMGLVDEIVPEGSCAAAPSRLPARSWPRNVRSRKCATATRKWKRRAVSPKSSPNSARTMRANSAASSRPNTISAASKRP